MKIAIIDYGMGNLFSVEQAVKRQGCEVIVTAEEAEILQADGIILPGVGAFEDAIKCLEDTGLKEVVLKAVQQQKKLLGICLGMQLLFQASEENGAFEGLGIFKGTVRKFNEAKVRVPHMGWNELQFTYTPDWLAIDDIQDRYVYFVHSYYATELAPEQLVAFAEYNGIQVPGIVKKGSVTGMQFHPEKSGQCGKQLLQAWLAEVKEESEYGKA